MSARIADALRRLAERLDPAPTFDWNDYGYPVDAVVEWETVVRDNLP